VKEYTKHISTGVYIKQYEIAGVYSEGGAPGAPSPKLDKH